MTTVTSRKNIVQSGLHPNVLRSGNRTLDLLKKYLFFNWKKIALLTEEEFEEKFSNLQKYCLSSSDSSPDEVHFLRLKGLKLLDKIINRIDIKILLMSRVTTLVRCCVSCVHYFQLRIRAGRGVMDRKRRSQAQKALTLYDTLSSMLLPEMSQVAVSAIVSFYTEYKMWHPEFLCTDLIKKMVANTLHIEQTVHAMLDAAELSTTRSTHNSRKVIRVLYDVLETHKWSTIDTDLMTRILSMFHRSIMPVKDDDYNYGPLKHGLEVCIRRILENLSNTDLIIVIRILVQWTFDDQVPDEALLDFGNILEFAAMTHKTYLYRDSFKSNLLPLILRLVASENRLHSLLGNRVFQHLVDRHNNRLQFDTPRIFFEGTHFNITLDQYSSEDKTFLSKYREMIHSTMLSSILQHGAHRVNLESIYASIALLVVEVPCGYTAAAVVCLAMSIQDSTMQDDFLGLECSHRLHATVMSIMSLVCWVHNAQIFYVYLNTVLGRRAQCAPHLNPPLKLTYQYAQHHVLWNKPELFFEDWEVRYGLWKCFRTRKHRLSITQAETLTEQT